MSDVEIRADLEREWAVFMENRPGPRGGWTQDQRWRFDNPGELTELEGYRAGGARPNLATATGRRMVAHLDAWLKTAPVVDPDPDPEPNVAPYGMVSNADVQEGMTKGLGAKLVRYEWGIGNSASALDDELDAFARAGAKVCALAGFHARMPSQAEAEGLRSWALRHGPQGTGKIIAIEFGNETGYSYQYAHTGEWWKSPELFARASLYADRALQAATALQGTGVGLLIQCDDGGSGSTNWINTMLDRQPALRTAALGHVIHPYGPGGFDRVTKMTVALRAKGVEPAWWFTEWGLSSDNGRPLTNNYGYPVDQTYDQAAATLRDVRSRWSRDFGSVLRHAFVYQIHDQKPSGSTNEREAFFGAVKSSGADKGSYSVAVREVLARTSL